jgi:hypothetical protein
MGLVLESSATLRDQRPAGGQVKGDRQQEDERQVEVQPSANLKRRPVEASECGSDEGKRYDQ